MTHSLIYLCLFILTLSSAQDCVKQLSQSQRDAILKAHNSYRNKVASGNQTAALGASLPQASNMKELIWDTELETLAQNWVNTNPTSHNENRVVPSAPDDYVGENIYWANKGNSRPIVPGSFNVEAGVTSWFGEVKFYDGNVAELGSETTTQVIGHFTQIIWADTLRIGCGISDCVTKSGSITYYKEAVSLVCDYRTGGNWDGAAIYLPGPAGSGCEKHSKNYTSLCAAN